MDLFRLGEYIQRHWELRRRPFVLPAALAIVVCFASLQLDIFPSWIPVAAGGFAVVLAFKALGINEYERRWLRKGRALINNLDPVGALKHLANPPFVMGAKALVRRELQRADALIAQNDLIAASDALHAVRQMALLPAEQDRLLLSEARMFLEVGHIRRFRDKLHEIRPANLPSDGRLLYHLLQAESHQRNADHVTAKQILEAELERRPAPKHLAPIYNNLGNFEGIQSNHLQAVHYYEKALDALREHPDAETLAIVYENLIAYAARAADVKRAFALLDNYREAIDTTNRNAHIEFLNTQIYLARQSRNTLLAHDYYATIDVRIRPQLNARERLIWNVTELRMRASDNIGFEEHVFRVHQIFDDLPGLPFHEHYLALREILNALRPLYDARRLSPVGDGLFHRTVDGLLDLRDEVAEYRKRIPDGLVAADLKWIGELIELHKLAPRTESDFNDAFYETLFDHLQESVRLTDGTDNHRLTLEALMLLCDDYADCLPHLDRHLKNTYYPIMQDALTRMETILSKHLADPVLFDYMIGLAWAEWKINDNREKAEHWVKLYESKNISPLHHATWFRGYRTALSEWLAGAAG